MRRTSIILQELLFFPPREEGGVFCVKSDNDRQIFVTGHTEYDWNTLLKEYLRDKEAGINPEIPANYFPDDDDSKKPVGSLVDHPGACCSQIG